MNRPRLTPVVGGLDVEVADGHVFIELFHGRADPSAVMDDWGSEGPIFGPFEYVHGTYGTDLKLGAPDGMPALFPTLTLVADLVYYDGAYYGDWSVFGGARFLAQLDGNLARHRPLDAANVRSL